MRVVAAESLREVEHKVNGRSYVLVLVNDVTVCSVANLAVEATLALPCVDCNASAKPRVELIAKTELHIRRNQVAELSLTQSVLSTTLKLHKYMLLKNSGVTISLKISGLCHSCRTHSEQGSCHNSFYCFHCLLF